MGHYGLKPIPFRGTDLIRASCDLTPVKCITGYTKLINNIFEFQSSHAGGGSGGSLWAQADSFTGTGKIRAVGGGGHGNGGGGAGGRINIFYNTGGFHSSDTIANGGRGASENGGPGIVYLQGLQPNIKNLRVDNKGLKAVVCSFSNLSFKLRVS